jgi:hypothetical protein
MRIILSNNLDLMLKVYITYYNTLVLLYSSINKYNLKTNKNIA